MKPRRPYTRYTVTKTADGHGGFTEALADASDIYGTMRVHKGEVRLKVDARAVVEVGDIVLVTQARRV